MFTSSKSDERAVLERVPFGSAGPSGLGACHGRHSFDLSSHAKSIVRRRARSLDPGLAYPPHGDRLKWMRRLLR